MVILCFWPLQPHIIPFVTYGRSLGLEMTLQVHVPYHLSYLAIDATHLFRHFNHIIYLNIWDFVFSTPFQSHFCPFYDPEEGLAIKNPINSACAVLFQLYIHSGYLLVKFELLNTNFCFNIGDFVFLIPFYPNFCHFYNLEGGLAPKHFINSACAVLF